MTAYSLLFRTCVICRNIVNTQNIITEDIFDDSETQYDDFVEIVTTVTANIDTSGINWLKNYDLQTVDEIPVISETTKRLRLSQKPSNKRSFRGLLKKGSSQYHPVQRYDAE